MEKKKVKKNEEGDDTRSEEREEESFPEGQDISSAFTTESIIMTTEEIDLIYDLARQGQTLDAVMQVLDVVDGTEEYRELERIYIEAVHHDFRESQAQGETHSQESSRSKEDDEDEDYEAYDAVLWHTATEENIIDQARDEEDALAPHPHDKDEVALEASGSPTSRSVRGSKSLVELCAQKLQLNAPAEPDFVRALKDSKMNTKPYFRKGHILRVIKKAQRGALDDRFFELLPLKPPGEAGQALVRNFEPADQEAADEVGREAKTEKEIDSFLSAMNWMD